MKKKGFKLLILSSGFIFITSCQITSTQPSNDNIKLLSKGGSEGMDGWSYSETVDPITDKKSSNTFIVNTASNVAGKEISTIIRIECEDNVLRAIFSFTDRTQKAIIRFDDNEPFEMEVFNWDDLALIVFNKQDALDFIETTKASESLVVRRQNLSALTVSDHYFELVKNNSFIDRVMVNCNVN